MRKGSMERPLLPWARAWKSSSPEEAWDLPAKRTAFASWPFRLMIGPRCSTSSRKVPEADAQGAPELDQGGQGGDEVPVLDLLDELLGQFAPLRELLDGQLPGFADLRQFRAHTDGRGHAVPRLG